MTGPRVAEVARGARAEPHLHLRRVGAVVVLLVLMVAVVELLLLGGGGVRRAQLWLPSFSTPCHAGVPAWEGTRGSAHCEPLVRGARTPSC